MNDYDFNPDEMDENNTLSLTATPIPYSLPHSLSNSRIKANNYASVYEALQEIHREPNGHMEDGQMEETETREMVKQEKKVKVRTKRDFDQFFKKQEAYEKKIQQKIQRMKQNIESKAVPQTFQPQINKKSKIYAKNKKENVFSRLYQKQGSKKPQTDTSMSFQPHISEKSKNIVRKEPVGETLYKDAQLRKQRQYQSIEKLKEEPMPVKNIITTNKNEQLAAKKLFKEYEHILQRLELSLHSPISKDIFVEVLFYMGFITSSTFLHLEVLLDEAYGALNRAGLNSVGLFAFLLILIGVYHVDPWLICNVRQTSYQTVFEEEQARQLHNRYKVLYNNRLCSEQKPSSPSASSPCTFKPQISQQSQFLAQKHRKQLLSEASKLIKPQLQQGNGSPKCKVITHPEFLILNQKMRELELSVKREAEIRKIMEQCTFKPKVSKFEVRNRRKSTRSGISEGMDLLNASMLILEVDFNGKEEEIVLKVADANALEGITKLYARKYSMDQESEMDLLSLLKSQFSSTFPHTLK